MGDPPGQILPPKAPERPQSGQIVKPSPPKPTTVMAPSPPMPRRAGTKREDRILRLEKQPVKLMGFYEAVPDDAKAHSGFTMQVNHAGLMLTGWISEVPAIVTGITPIKTLPAPRPGERIGFGVFVAPLSPTFIGRLRAGEYLVPFQWTAFERPPENINTFDATLSGGANEGQPRSGTLRLQYVQGPDYAYLGVRAKALGFSENKSWQITGINFEGAPHKGFDAVRLVRRKLRLPYSVIRQVEIVPLGSAPADPKRQRDVLRDMLIASHVCIIPESHLLKILRIATKLFIYGPAGQEADTPPQTEAALDEWLKAPPTPAAARRIARDKVLSLLTTMHNDIAALPYAYHREIVRDLFIDNARKVNKGQQSYFDLYVQLLDEELRDRPESAEAALEPILRWGTFPMASGGNKSFRYTLSLSPLLSLPTTPLPVNGAAASFEVKCERVEFELDAQGRKQIDRVSGNPMIKKVMDGDVVYDTSKQSTGGNLWAVTGAFGIAPTAVPSTVELFSRAGDLKYEDFADATFSFVWIQGTPDVKIGPYAEVKALATGFFDVTLPRKNNLELWGSVTQLPSVEVKITATGKEAAETITTLPKSAGDAIKKGKFVRPYAEDIYKKGPEAAAEGWLDSLRLKNLKQQFKQIIGVTVGVGRVLAPQSFRTSDGNRYEAPKPTLEDTHVSASNRIANFFERDSADFSGVVQRIEQDNIVRLLTSRDLVEFFLALYLDLVMNRDAHIELLGHASPEGPVGPLPAGQYDKYNLDLSEQRVDAVHYALIDAMLMFPTDAWASVELDWKGEAVARDSVTQGGGGLADPPGTGNTAAFLQWLKTHRDEVERWPNWRRVDLRLGGVALLRLYD